MHDNVTLRQIAEATGISKRTIERRAARESWPSCGTTIVNHNTTKLYAISDLPADIRIHLETNAGERLFTDKPATPTPYLHIIPASSTSTACPAAGNPVPDPLLSKKENGNEDLCRQRGFFPPVSEQVETAPHPGLMHSIKRDLASDHLPQQGEATSLKIIRPDSATELKAWQRDVMTARLTILGAVESVAASEGLTINRAIERFLQLLAGGMIDAAISAMAETANNRKGNERSLTKGTIYRWIHDRKQLGNLGLAPADKEIMTVPPWAREFMALHRLPSKPTVPMVLEKMGDLAPSYGQACRFIKKFSRVDAQRGRMSGSELRSIRGYTRRGKENLVPLDVVVADGHSFKAKVAHPVHGRPFHPEMEGVIDVATRVCIGWSIGLAESSHVVADALRHAVTVSEKKMFGGVPAIFYADQGSGNTAKAVSHIEMGVLARIGSQFKTGIAGNPQGRGVIEKLQESMWIRAAKELPTYTGKDMDTLALRRIMKIVNKDFAVKGTSELLITWSRFLHFADDQVTAYNNRPHSAHPRIADMQTGLRRNMTPAEMWQSFLADGWQPTLLSMEEINDLFKPMVRVRCRRAQVTVFGNIYYHKTLEHYHGEEVLVNYDIHDAKIVWVRDMEQRLICEAVWDANKRDYFPVPVIEQARQKRMEGRLKRLEDQAWEVRQERKGVIGAALPQEDPIIADMAPNGRKSELIMTEFDVEDIAL